MRLDESSNARGRSAEVIRAARALMEPPPARGEPVWPALAAAAFFAASAMTFATVALLAPSAQTPPPVHSAL